MTKKTINGVTILERFPPTERVYPVLFPWLPLVLTLVLDKFQQPFYFLVRAFALNLGLFPCCH